MIGLSSKTYDLNGAIYFRSHDIVQNSTKTGDINRRATRTATIDGGASLYDAGYTASDRSIRIAISPDFENLEGLRDLVKNYERVIVTTDEGAFEANPNSLTQSASAWTLTLLVLAEV